MSSGEFNSLPSIDDVEPINVDDEACLEEVLVVLKKHGKANRFGIALLHKHFDLAPGEVLVETTDIELREQKIIPRKLSLDSDQRSIATIIGLSDGTVMSKCIVTCVVDTRTDRHPREHVEMGDL